MKQGTKRWMRTGLIVLSVLLALSIAPYLFAVTTARTVQDAPFEESAFFETNGVRLHYRVWEPANERALGKVLLVHGLGGSTFCWRRNTDALVRAGYLVVAVDLPGFGYSDRKRGIDHSQENRSLLLWNLLEWLDETLPAQAKEDRWNLVGHSMGGGTVASMALANPDGTRSIVLVDGAVLTGGGSLGILMEYPPVQRWLEVLGRHLFFTRGQVGKFLSTAYGSAPSNADIDGYLEPLLLDGTEGALTDLVQSATVMEESAFQELTVPVYGIWGEQDTWVPLEEAYRLQAALPSIEIKVIPGAGHCPMETHSAALNQLLIEALAGAANE